MREDGTERRGGSGRRELLKLAGLGAVAGAAAVVSPKGRAEAAENRPSARGYRETAHVKTYYELARF